MTTPGITLKIGAPVPWFEARSPDNPRFSFDTVAGRHVVLCFFGSAGEPHSRRLLDEFLQRRSLFDYERLTFFGVSVDPEDERAHRVQQALPGIHLFWDFDRKVSRLFGAEVPSADPAELRYRPFSLVLDERLRLVALVPFVDDPERHVAKVLEALATLPALGAAATPGPAPILNVPRVFEPELCRALMQHYEEHGGGESGFMQDIGGKTVGVHDYRYKRRKDHELTDEPLKKACMVRIHDRLLPEIARAFQFHATRIERYLTACYEAETGGHFRAHRDNTTKATAHRRFAVSLVLNTGEFEGGDLRLPEFGPQRYCPPAGGALVFSCSLLHEVTPVTRGKRFAFLPFLYDDAAARIREETRQYLEEKEPAGA